jgi:hypothetical protein
MIQVAWTAMGLNVDEIQSGGLLEKHTIATWNFVKKNFIFLKEEDNQRNVCRDVQDLSDAH